MKIEYRTAKLEQACLKYKKAKVRFGKPMAEKIAQRIAEIRAMPSLSDLPGPRCHQLKGRRKDQFAVDLVHPKRFIFIPVGKRQEIAPRGVYDLEKITHVKIIEVGDYH